MKSLLYKISIVFVILLICLSISEIYLRIIYNEEKEHLITKYKKIDPSRDLCIVKSTDSLLIYTFVPNTCAFNSHGYFDYEYTYTKPEDVFRIVIIGDSVAQGFEMKLEDSFGKVLERTLNTLKTNKSYEVIVLARAGYSTSQEVFLLKNEAPKYSPDLILWSYVLNDPAHPVYHDVNGELGRYFYVSDSYAFDFISKKLFFLKEKIKGRNCNKEFHVFLHCAYQEQVDRDIKEIGIFLKKEGIPIVFLIHPVFEKNKTFQDYSLVNLHSKLSRLADNSGLIPVDLLDAFKPYMPDEVKLPGTKDNYDVWHPNKKGHEVLADHLYKFISALDILRN